MSSAPGLGGRDLTHGEFAEPRRDCQSAIRARRQDPSRVSGALLGSRAQPPSRPERQRSHEVGRSEGRRAGGLADARGDPPPRRVAARLEVDVGVAGAVGVPAVEWPSASVTVTVWSGWLECT